MQTNEVGDLDIELTEREAGDAGIQSERLRNSYKIYNNVKFT